LGEEQLAHPLYLFILPLANLAIFILNSILLSFIEKKELFDKTNPYYLYFVI